MDVTKREKKSVKWKKQASTKSNVSTGNATNQNAGRPRTKLFGPFNFWSGRLNTKLFTAVHEGEVVDVQTCIDEGVDLSMAGPAGNIMRLACERGNVDVVEALVRAGASHSMLGDDNSAAIYVAARQGNPRIVTLLISQGANVNVPTRFEQRTPLHAATMQGRHDVVALLLGSGADVNKTDIYGGTALHLAARNGNLAIVELLVMHGADVNKADNEGWTALHLAAETGQTVVVRLLLQRRAIIDRQNRYGRTPLHWACASNQASVVEVLLQHGANYKVLDVHGNPPDTYVVSMSVMDTLKAHTKTNDQQSTQYAGSVGLLMQIDRRARTRSGRRGALHDRRTRSLDDGGDFPQPSFETLAFRNTQTSFPLPPTFEETTSIVSTGSKDEPETVAEVFKTFTKLNDSVNRNIEQLQSAMLALAHDVSVAEEADSVAKSKALLHTAHTRTQHVQHLLDDFGVEYSAMSRLVSWSVDELRRDHSGRDCASSRSILMRCFFQVVSGFLIRQSFGWQKLIRQMSQDDKQSDAIIEKIDAGNGEAGFRAHAALIEWTKQRHGSASSLCIKTLLEDLRSCTFDETTDIIVNEFATFMMKETGKTQENPDDQTLTMVVEKLGMAWLDFFKGLGVPPDRLIEAKHEVPCIPHQRNRRLILEWKQNCNQSPDAMFTALTGWLIDTCLEDLLAVLFPMNAPPAAVHISSSTVEPSEASFNGSDQHSGNEC
ncbi:hypothetical protein NP493_172g03071 [Ridgeia piscesae]|uniref:Death domain-containing protein n=1 Tax=Ridgeia piscesae TaxID=27915 RepID=A0AAD9UFD3_RIDPI|nr:hypothetical protein NP493_172g03071 [Ridgeia piscesae]